MQPRTVRAALGAALCLLLIPLAACGDADSDDPRGYTKDPIEEPGFVVKPEPNTEMSELGEPNRPVVREIEPGDTVRATPAS